MTLALLDKATGRRAQRRLWILEAAKSGSGGDQAKTAAVEPSGHEEGWRDGIGQDKDKKQ